MDPGRSAGQDAEVITPVEQDSEAMPVLSPEEEVRYFSAALRESMDFHDVERSRRCFTFRPGD